MRNSLAIVIPYYKIYFFEDTLKSVAFQTDKRFTLYIGDDASPNNPEDVLSKFEGKLPFHYTKFEDNLGGTFLTQQWNRCIALSKDEDWIMILGDDDTLEHNAVEKFYENLPIATERNIQVMRYASQLINEQGSAISKIFINPTYENAAVSYMRILRGNGRSTLTEHIFSRKSYQKYGFKHFPVAFGSDNVAWLEFPEMGEILSINDSKAYIRISGEHLSSRDDGDLKFLKKEGIYLFNRYIISKYSKFFSREDRYLILKKAYKFLTLSTFNKLKSIEFIVFMMRFIPLAKVLKIVKENRHR